MSEIKFVIECLRKENIFLCENEPLSKHTTFKIGGSAKVFCSPTTENELCRAVCICRENNVRYYLLGKGSNILFADEGFDGVVIHISDTMNEMWVKDNVLTAQAGAALSQVCQFAAKNSLEGLAFAYGIPGNIGGAVYMNAGAYGGEMKDVLESVTFLDEKGEIRTLQAKDLKLSYRTSVFEKEPWVILRASFKLAIGNEDSIKAEMQKLAKSRVEKQPLDMPSAGSTFKRPEGAFAGALIDECGLRGFSVGGAQISTKHCGFVVNMGNATCNDVLNLANEVCNIVKRETGFNLEKEIRVVK